MTRNVTIGSQIRAIAVRRGSPVPWAAPLEGCPKGLGHPYGPTPMRCMGFTFHPASSGHPGPLPGCKFTVFIMFSGRTFLGEPCP